MPEEKEKAISNEECEKGLGSIRPIFGLRFSENETLYCLRFLLTS